MTQTKHKKSLSVELSLAIDNFLRVGTNYYIMKSVGAKNWPLGVASLKWTSIFSLVTLPNAINFNFFAVRLSTRLP